MTREAPGGDDHAIIQKAVGLLEVDEGRYLLREPAIAELGRELDALVTSWELPLAVDALLRLAHVLEAEWSSPKAADALCALIERDNVLDALRALAQEAREQLEDDASPDAEEFRQFTGSAGKKAPKVGETPPEGAVKLDAFKAPRRV